MAEKSTYEELEQRVKELEEESYKHKQIEKLLRGEKEFIAFLIDNAPTFFVAIDHHGKVMMMNQHMLKTLGYTADEVVGKDYLANFVPERDRDMLTTVFSRLATEYKHTLNENYLLSKDGCELLVEWHGAPVFDTNGAFQYFYGIGIDITDRKHAEDALRESEERFRELADSLPQIVFETDEKGIITFANRMAFDYFGYTNSELENKLNALQMISPEDRDRAVKNIQKVFNGEILGSIEYTALKKNGNTFPVEINSTAFFQTNKPIGMRGVITDLSKKKRAEEILRESEEKFRNIAETSLAGIYIVQDGIFMYVNTKFAEIFGYSVEECLNKMHIRQTVHPEDLDFVREQISKRVSGKFNSVNYTFRGIKKNGKTIHVEIFGSATQLNGKSAVTGTILDITERKQAEEQRNKLITELQNALSEVKTLQGFLPICSHCKKIRDDKGYWDQIESYIHKHSDAEFSHGICPECAEKYYPGMDLYGENET